MTTTNRDTRSTALEDLADDFDRMCEQLSKLAAHSPKADAMLTAFTAAFGGRYEERSRYGTRTWRAHDIDDLRTDLLGATDDGHDAGADRDRDALEAA